MKIFVSGATGYIGLNLVRYLAGSGHQVIALYRSETKKELLSLPGVIPVKGDIVDYPSLLSALNGCEQAYHVAAFAGVWTPDPYSVYKTTVLGSLNVIRAARENNVKRVVLTSTAGILGPTAGRDYTDEEVPDPASFFSDYEAAKFILENTIRTWKQQEPEIVLVNPTRVYGPGLLSESNGVTRMIMQYVKGKWKLIPGNGKSIGNYVFIDDVVMGHVLAMEHGNPGERYLLGGENASYDQFFTTLKSVSGVRKKLWHIPDSLSLFLANLMLFFARNFGTKPLIVPGLVKKFSLNWIVSSEKAEKQLNYRITPLSEGMKKTLSWLRESGKIHD